MALKIRLDWEQTASYSEEVGLDSKMVADMEASGVDYMNPEAVFNWLNDRDELIKYEPYSYGRSELDKDSSCVTVTGIVEG